MKWAEVPIETAVMTVTENPALAMKLRDRGKLEPGTRGDFVILTVEGDLKETWVRGKRIWGKS